MDEELLKERKRRVKRIITLLEKLYPNAKLALTYATPWQLMVAVQLSAQSTDKKVNEILPRIFSKYPSVEAFATSDPKELEEALNSVLYYRNKARNIRATAQKVLAEFDGALPESMEELLTLPGVARKTANVLLGTLFDKKEGIVVDTHVIRFSRRFNLTEYTDAVKIERDLLEVVPKSYWYRLPYLIIEYGREYGNPRGKRALHEKDPLLKLYPSAKGYWP